MNPYRFVRRVVHFAGPAALGLLLLSSGCDPYSGESEAFLNMKNAKSNFEGLIKEMGGSARYEHFNVAGQDGYAWVIDLKSSKFTPEQFDKMLEILTLTNDYVAQVDLSDSAITDDQFVRYDKAMHGRTVMNLNLSNTAVTDKAIDGMDNFNCLDKFNLKGTKVTKAAVDRMLDRRRKSKDTMPMFLNPKVAM